VDNGVIEVAYDDGTVKRHPLHNPTTYDAMLCNPFAKPNIPEPLGSFHADTISISLDPKRTVSTVRLTCLSNEAIIRR